MVRSRQYKIWMAVAVVAVGCVHSVLAQEDAGWRFSLGATYRAFEDVELSAFQRNGWLNPGPSGTPAGQPTNSDLFANGFIEAQIQQINPGVSAPVLHRNMTFSGADAEADESGGGMVTATSPKIDWAGGMRLDLSMIFLRHQFNANMRGVMVRESVFQDVGGNWQPGAPTTKPKGQAMYDVDFSLISYGIGATKEFVCRKWYVSGGAGPTLNMVNYAIERESSVRYLNTSLGRQTKSADDLELCFGLYGRVAAGYEIQENVNLEIGCRYDWVEDVETSLADLKLSGLSGDIALTFAF